MKTTLAFVFRVLIPAAFIGLSLATSGCASRVIFDGVALVRSNGEIIVVQRADSVAALHDSKLALTASEWKLLESLAARRDQAHARAHPDDSTLQSGRCLTGTGSTPTCYPVLPCKGCKVVSQGLASDGQLSAVREEAEGAAISFSAPYAYYCECDSW